jgi:hypothetical protein
MSSGAKPDLVSAWLKIEDAIAHDEAARMEALGDEERHAEMRAEGLDPEGIPSAEELLAGARAKAAARKALHAGGGRHVSHIAALRPRRRSMRAVWLAAAAFLLVLGALAATESAAIVAWLRGPTEEPIRPDEEKAPPAPTPHEMAQKLRDEARQSFILARYSESLRKLDAAKEIDPAGEEEPEVRVLRRAVTEMLTPPPRDNPKKPPK